MCHGHAWLCGFVRAARALDELSYAKSKHDYQHSTVGRRHLCDDRDPSLAGIRSCDIVRDYSLASGRMRGRVAGAEDAGLAWGFAFHIRSSD